MAKMHLESISHQNTLKTAKQNFKMSKGMSTEDSLEETALNEERGKTGHKPMWYKR